MRNGIGNTLLMVQVVLCTHAQKYPHFSWANFLGASLFFIPTAIAILLFSWRSGSAKIQTSDLEVAPISSAPAATSAADAHVPPPLPPSPLTEADLERMEAEWKKK